MNNTTIIRTPIPVPDHDWISASVLVSSQYPRASRIRHSLTGPQIAESKAGMRRVFRYGKYLYRDEHGKRAFEYSRNDEGYIYVYNPALPGPDKYQWGFKGVELLPYRLNELVKTLLEDSIFIGESEEDADCLANKHLTATTNPGGSGMYWRTTFDEYFTGHHVVIIPKNDLFAWWHARQIAECLYGTAATIKFVGLPDLPQGGSVTDWVKAGGKKKELLALAANTPIWTPDALKATHTLPVKIGDLVLPQLRIDEMSPIEWKVVSSRHESSGVERGRS